MDPTINVLVIFLPVVDGGDRQSEEDRSEPSVPPDSAADRL